MKKELKMTNLCYDTIEELAYDIFCEYEDLDGDDKNISIIAKYEEARQLIKEFMCLDFDIVSINGLENPDFNLYEDEFFISLTAIDNDYELWCEPCIRDGKYVIDEAHSIYVLDDCSSKVLDFLDAKNMYDVSIKDDDDFTEEEFYNFYEDESKCECSCSCNGCECKENKEEITSASPTVASNVHYTVNGIPVGYEVYQKYEKVIEDKMKKFEQEMDIFRRAMFGL